MAPNATPTLFTPVNLGGSKDPLQLKHRVFMPPLTRMRAGQDGVPSAANAEYYAQRATDGGLLIAEGTDVNATARGFYNAPGIFTDDQVKGWKTVTDVVHAKGGVIFVQIYHCGRVTHPITMPKGATPVAPSAVGFADPSSWAITKEGRKKYVTPRALEVDEIKSIVDDFRKAAVNAFAAGFDGVELHSANGYLFEEFLCDSTNSRTDEYGGSVENRARLLFETLDTILEVAPSSGRVGVRLSPFGVTFECTDSAPVDTFGYVVRKLSDYDLAYLNLIEPAGYHYTSPMVPEGGVLPVFRPMYKGVILAAGGFTRASAIDSVEQGLCDLVGFGRDFIATPDLVHRLKIDAPLNTVDAKTYYTKPGAPVRIGYTDYPFLEDGGKEPAGASK